MTVTHALATLRESKVARLTFVTLPTKCWLQSVTRALTRVLVTELILTPPVVTLTPPTSRGRESVSCRSTGVTSSTEDQALTGTVTVIFVTHPRIGASLVTVTHPH